MKMKFRANDNEIAFENCKNQIVSEKTILKLFEVCRLEGCGAIVLPQDIDVVYLGMYMLVSQNCTTCKNEKFVWETSEKVKNKLSKTDLEYIIEAKCIGLPTSQVFEFTNGMNIRNFCRKTWSMIEHS